jgi:hypothetical protein
VQLARQQSLAAAGLTQDQNCGRAPRADLPEEPVDLLSEGQDRRAVPQDLAEGGHGAS